MPTRQTSALHAHRWSQPAATYFVTCCTQERRSGLTATNVTHTLKQVTGVSDAQDDTTTHAFAVMPDHVHWLFTLGRRLTLGRVLSRWKTQTKGALQLAGLDWQRDFYEHQLRPDEAMEPYALYIFLNPYRAGLLTADDAWAHWHCPVPGRFDFTTHLSSNGAPPSEWIDELIPSSLSTGE
ncbi:MAG: transposase [Verrucomicrobia bacterium]|nr:transposase [Verrucomicrobiota bacterium]